MVVNKKGGNKTKKQKKTGTDESDRPLVFKNILDLQEYGQVLKALGNGRFEVNCFDGKTRLAHARGSLKKKKIFIKVGDVVLMSLREFEDAKCDILYQYKPKEVVALKKMGEIPGNIIEDIAAGPTEETDIGFDIEDDDEDDEEIKKREEFKRDFESNFEAI